MPPNAPRDPAFRRDRDRQDTGGAAPLWIQSAVWAALAVCAGVAVSVIHTWWRFALVALTVLLAGLTIWVGFVAVLSGAIGRVARAPGRNGSLGPLIPFPVWVLVSVAVGVLAGTGAYISGPVNLVAVQLASVAAASALTSRRTTPAPNRRKVWVCFGAFALTSTCISLTVFL